MPSTIDYERYSRTRLVHTAMEAFTDHLNPPFRHRIPQLVLGMSSPVVPPEARHRNTCPLRALNSSLTFNTVVRRAGRSTTLQSTVI